MNLFYEVNQILHKRVAKGMTFPEMLCFIALVVFVVIGGKSGNRIVGTWYGYLLGGILGIVACVVCIFGLGFLMHLWKKYKKSLRQCRYRIKPSPYGTTFWASQPNRQ